MQTILIVDDDKSIRYSLKRMMEGKYSILTAQNGEEALERVKESSPDLIIMDIKMPGRSGIDVLKEIKLIDPKSLGHHDDGLWDHRDGDRGHEVWGFRLYPKTLSHPADERAG